MQNLTDKEAIKKIDPQDTVGSTELMVEQFETAWKQVNDISFTQDFSAIKNIVFCGMGASIYGALVLKSILGRELPFPVEIITDYHLPPYASEHTLVVLTSYSGTTEEVLSCAEEAKAMGAKMLILTKGGPLAEFAKEHTIPAYIFDGKLNPAGTPRLGNGYTILGLLGLLLKTKVISIADQKVENAIQRLKDKLPSLKEHAAKDSELYLEKIPVIFSAEHLSGNAQILRNQFNETSKTFSSYYLVPDLNHHLMEGLQFPKKHSLVFIVLNSPNYSPKIKKRMELTIDVVKQNNHTVYEFMTSGQTMYDDVLEVIGYGSFLTLYLALRLDQNPAINPWVDYFKNKLK